MLNINEIFVTIQGEGSFTGYPSVFVRLQGCNVGCAWCDTKHTWAVNPDKIISFEDMLSKLNDDDCYSYISSMDLAHYLINTHPQITHIVLTGGEPAMYNLEELTTLLHNAGKMVQLETSGTSDIRVHDNTWVTLSPKIIISPNVELIPHSVIRANELKFPVGKQDDINSIHGLIKKYPSLAQIKIWLQPISQNKTALSLCIEQAIQNNWNLSVQVHKYIFIR